MPIKLFIFSKQRNVTCNIIESEREYYGTHIAATAMHFCKDCEYKANCKGNISPPKEERGKKEKRGEQEEKEGDFFCKMLAPGTYLPFPDLPRWDDK